MTKNSTSDAARDARAKQHTPMQIAMAPDAHGFGKPLAERQHTPGPWYVDAAHHGMVRDAATDSIVVEDAYIADARLIASAPELLEALESLYRMGEHQRTVAEHGPLVGAIYATARKAIAKAKGAAQ